jgi:hypothetical protein
VFLLIGDGGVNRVAKRARDAIREPPLQAHIHRDRREDRDQNGRDQGNDGEDTGQPQMQTRSRRPGPPRRNDPGHFAQHQGRDDQDIDHVDQQDQSQPRLVGQLCKRAQDEKGHQRQDRAQNDQAQGAQGPQFLPVLQPPKSVDDRQMLRAIRWIVQGLLSPISTGPWLRPRNSAGARLCHPFATRLLRVYINLRRRVTRISRSVIFLRKVLRLMPRRSAHFA